MAAAWVTVRALTGATAESVPTTSTEFVFLGQESPRVEVRVHDASLANAPASVTLAVWRESGGVVDKLGTIRIAAADIAQPIPQLFEVYESNLYVTVESFSGGASPTLTATIEARAVFGG